jgi:hypothetical protein
MSRDWRGTLSKIACNFLCCNHQVHGEFLIILHNECLKKYQLQFYFNFPDIPTIYWTCNASFRSIILKKTWTRERERRDRVYSPINIYINIKVMRGTRWRSWLRHCATSRKVAGLIPDGVTWIFHWHSSDHDMVLGLTQPLTEMGTRNNSWGVKVAGV